MPHFLENGSTMPAIDTAPAGKTLQPLHTRPFGKVPRFTVKAVHFPGGNAKGLPPGGPVPRLREPARGKVPESRKKPVHFPGGNAKGLPPGGPVPRLHKPARGESARIAQETGSLSRWECRGNARGLPPGGLCPGCADQPGGKKGARRKGNAATDAVADMVRELTFRRWDDFAGKLLLEVDVEAADPFALGSGLDDYDVTADAVLVDAVGLEEGVAVAADDDVDIL